MENSIKALIDVSRKYGSDSSFVIAGGGNTSYKNDSQIWIKASGVSLATIDENGFVCLSRKKLKVVSQKSYSTNALQRENEVKADLANAIISPENLRPSVETSLHEIIGYSFIVHTHPTKVNGLMCSNGAEEWCDKLFGKSALFVPYTDPGYILFKKLETDISAYREQFGHDPKIIFLENHGVFAGADTVSEIDSIYDEMMKKIESAIKQEIADEEYADYSTVLTEKVRELHPGFKNFYAAGKSGKLIGGFVKDATSFAKADTAFSPDDIVYCKAHYLFLPKMGNEAKQIAEAKERTSEYVTKYGYLPKVLAVEGEGIIAVEDSLKSVQNVLDVYINILRISFYTENFGGQKFMNAEQIEFIDNWEVENYRRKMAKS